VVDFKAANITLQHPAKLCFQHLRRYLALDSLIMARVKDKQNYIGGATADRLRTSRHADRRSVWERG
jgi:hypothetical protein